MSEQTPQRVHAEALVIDTHADTPQRFVDQKWDFLSPLTENGMINYETAKNGGLDAEFFAVWVDPSQYPANRSAARTLALIDGVLEQVRKHPNELTLCRTPDEILSAREAGKFAICIGIEGGHSIENDLGLLRNYYRLGVRYMTLTWANTNDWADSSGDIDNPNVKHHNGLTEFGKEVIAEMNRLGMMVDISHVSDKTFWDVAEVSQAPLLASHSSARAVTPAMRNLTDEQIRAVAKSGGVVMVNFYPAFIDDSWRLAWNAQRPERLNAYAALKAEYDGKPVPYTVSELIDRKYAEIVGRAPFESLIDHFDHTLKVAGIEHVGIGTDFDGIAQLPGGIDSAADLPRITAALMERGYSGEDLKKVLGLNLIRVFREVQAKADPTFR